MLRTALAVALLATSGASAQWTPAKTYSDPTHGVTFQYPAVMKPITDLISSDGPSLLDTTETVSPVVLAAAPHPGFYGGTSLSAIYFTYAQIPVATPGACDKLAVSVVATGQEAGRHVTIHGTRYTVHATEDAGLSHWAGGQLYSTLRSGTCFLFEASTAGTVPGVIEGQHPITPAQSHSIDAHLQAIVQSIRFTAPHPAVAPNPPPLATYRDAGYGVTFDYPAVWKRPSATKSQPPFDYCPPAAFGPDTQHGVPISAAVQFTGDDNLYAHTELSSLVFIYGIQPHTTTAACHHLADIAEDHKPDSTVINGVPFTTASGGECGLGHGVDAKVYTTFRHNTCYVFEEDFYTAHANDARQLTQTEMRALQRHLDAIMQTVRFDWPD